MASGHSGIGRKIFCRTGGPTALDLLLEGLQTYRSHENVDKDVVDLVEQFLEEARLRVEAVKSQVIIRKNWKHTKDSSILVKVLLTW